MVVDAVCMKKTVTAKNPNLISRQRGGEDMDEIHLNTTSLHSVSWNILGGVLATAAEWADTRKWFQQSSCLIENIHQNQF